MGQSDSGPPLNHEVDHHHHNWQVPQETQGWNMGESFPKDRNRYFQSKEEKYWVGKKTKHRAGPSQLSLCPPHLSLWALTRRRTELGLALCTHVCRTCPWNNETACWGTKASETRLSLPGADAVFLCTKRGLLLRAHGHHSEHVCC